MKAKQLSFADISEANHPKNESSESLQSLENSKSSEDLSIGSAPLSHAEGLNEFKNYWKETGRQVHGGEYAKSKRKTARPFDSTKPLHIVMRSEKAKGAWSLRQIRVKADIESLIRHYAEKFNVKIYNFSVNSNHLHILAHVKRKKSLSRFLKSLTGHVARRVTGARKGNPQGKFWDALTFTRIAHWGRAYQNLKNYVIKNILESAGVISYTPRRPTTEIKEAPA